jgi:hypothetical protein
MDEALTWLDIHAERPDVVEHWRELKQQGFTPQAPVEHEREREHPSRRRRRRRRRRRAMRM